MSSLRFIFPTSSIRITPFFLPQYGRHFSEKSSPYSRPFQRPSSPKGSFPHTKFPLPHDHKATPITPPYFRSSTPPFRAENIKAFEHEDKDAYEEYLMKETERQPEEEQDPSKITFVQQYPAQKVERMHYQLVTDLPTTTVYAHEWKHHPGVIEEKNSLRTSSLSPDEVEKIKFLREANPWKWTQGTLAKRFNVSKQEIMDICTMPAKKLRPASLKFVKYEKNRQSEKNRIGNPSNKDQPDLKQQ